MSLESGTYISDLDSDNPTPGDPKREGDDHIRLIKACLKATFPNFTGAITATHIELNAIDGLVATPTELNILNGALLSTSELNTLSGATLSTAELNILDGVTANTTELNVLAGAVATTAEVNHLSGVTAAIQGQLDNKAPLDSPTLTGTPVAPTPTAGDNSNKIATTEFVYSAALSIYPALTGNAGKYLRVAIGAGSVEWVTPTASEVSFNNVASGLTATDAQAAVDEIDSTVDGLATAASTGASSDVSYSNSSSGLTATNAQAAIDELDTAVDGKEDLISVPAQDNLVYSANSSGVKSWRQVDASIFV